MKISLRAEQINLRNDPWHVHGLAMQARAKGEAAILLTVGDPDCASPQAAVDAAKKALDKEDTHFTPVQGKLSLREAIARYSSRPKLDVVPQQVTVVAGVQAGILAASLTLFDPADEVLVVEPAFVSYAPSLILAGVHPVCVPPLPSLRMGKIEEYVSSKTKGIIFSDPSNPTGLVMDVLERERVAALAEQHNLWVVSDEIYSQVSWDAFPETIALLPNMAARTIRLDGASKSFAMTGWRSGWLISPTEVSHAITAVADLMAHGTAGFVQEGVIAALQDGWSTRAAIIGNCRQRAQTIVRELKLSKLVPFWPEAGMFVLINIAQTGLDAVTFAKELWHKEQVAVLPGTAFGASLQDWIRVSLSTEDAELVEALKKMATFSANLD